MTFSYRYPDGFTTKITVDPDHPYAVHETVYDGNVIDRRITSRIVALKVIHDDPCFQLETA